MPLEDDPHFGEKPDPADDWKKGYDRKPVRMLDGELFGLLSIGLMLGAGVLFFFDSSNRTQADTRELPVLTVLSGVSLCAGIVCACFALYKAFRTK
ncbi:MAG: hypothetical protein KIS92_02825 [Planctomycetota bacterium]|nr:hypothetical protein [Planctomycetota bacterium]